MITTVNGKLEYQSLDLAPDYFCTVVMASAGYPGTYTSGLPVRGLEHVPEGVQVFHSGTQRNKEGELLTRGGRVLSVVGRGSTLQQAIDAAYEGVERIEFEGAYYRKDIGAKGLRYFNS